MIQVEFTCAREFMDELEKNALYIDAGIVRITTLYQPLKNFPDGESLTVIAAYTLPIAGAGAILDGTRQIIRLNVYFGDTIFNPEQVKIKAQKMTEMLVDKIQAISEKNDLNLEIRSGWIQEAQ